MTDLDLDTTVGRWVMQHPRTSRVFEALQIDYCCGGKKALNEACRERNLEPLNSDNYFSPVTTIRHHH